MQDVKLDGVLVKEVSRSFYLTLRLLPADIRELISLGYLLARASDTIADTAHIPWRERKECLRLFRDDFLEGEASAALLGVLSQKFANQKHEGERVLMAQVSPLFRSLYQFDADEQAMLTQVIETIIEGQLWDLEYFQESKELQHVDSAQQLELYTYQVAGCVGEFWTQVLAHHDYIASEDVERMLREGINYGKGLQLTNIIRDIAEDFENGRVYIPGGQNTREGVIESSESWMNTAVGYLKDGIDYSKALPVGRLKTATILPARLGLKTLELLKNSSSEQRAISRVKISRTTVFATLVRSLIV